MRPRKTTAERQFDDAYNATFRRQASGVQFNVLDLGRMRAETAAAVAAGAPLAEAFARAVAKYRQN